MRHLSAVAFDATADLRPQTRPCSSRAHRTHTSAAQPQVTSGETSNYTWCSSHISVKYSTPEDRLMEAEPSRTGAQLHNVHRNGAPDLPERLGGPGSRIRGH